MFRLTAFALVLLGEFHVSVGLQTAKVRRRPKGLMGWFACCGGMPRDEVEEIPRPLDSFEHLPMPFQNTVIRAEEAEEAAPAELERKNSFVLAPSSKGRKLKSSGSFGKTYKSPEEKIERQRRKILELKVFDKAIEVWEAEEKLKLLEEKQEAGRRKSSNTGIKDPPTHDEVLADQIERHQKELASFEKLFRQEAEEKYRDLIVHEKSQLMELKQKKDAVQASSSKGSGDSPASVKSLEEQMGDCKRRIAQFKDWIQQEMKLVRRKPKFWGRISTLEANLEQLEEKQEAVRRKSSKDSSRKDETPAKKIERCQKRIDELLEITRRDATFGLRIGEIRSNQEHLRKLKQLEEERNAGFKGTSENTRDFSEPPTHDESLAEQIHRVESRIVRYKRFGGRNDDIKKEEQKLEDLRTEQLGELDRMRMYIGPDSNSQSENE